MPKPLKLYWDSAAWLGLINGEADKKRELQIVYGHAKKGHYEIWTSTLAYMECRRLDVEKQSPRPLDPANEKIITDIFRQPCVKPIPLTVDIAEMARTVWRQTPGLGGGYQDAVHLVSALRWNVPVMHTYDRDDLIDLTESFDCKDGTPLIICYPDETTDGPLFSHAKG